jgi:hypothetical protein
MSFIWPLTLAANAARAKPAPMLLATSFRVVPTGYVRSEPSGRVTLIDVAPDVELELEEMFDELLDMMKLVPPHSFDPAGNTEPGGDQ